MEYRYCRLLLYWAPFVTIRVATPRKTFSSNFLAINFKFSMFEVNHLKNWVFLTFRYHLIALKHSYGLDCFKASVPHSASHVFLVVWLSSCWDCHPLLNKIFSIHSISEFFLRLTLLNNSSAISGVVLTLW